MKAAIVVPTIREDCIRLWLERWEPQFRDQQVIIVEDGPDRTFATPEWARHFSWREIDADLKDAASIIPRRSGAIRSYGILVAARLRPDMIVLLDDDCLPCASNEFLDGHWRALNTPGLSEPLFNTMHAHEGGEIVARGFPKELRMARTVLNHGLWNNIPDLDGATQLQHPDLRTRFSRHSMQVPPGVFFPMSAMNVAFRPELAQAMYQIPMGRGLPFHRFDDIWCGWIMKRACDAMGWAVRSGGPHIEHVRASDPNRNAEQEAPGILENERVWRAVHSAKATGGDLGTCLREIHEALRRFGPYWHDVHERAATWRRLIREA